MMNSLKTSVRYLWKHKVFSGINLIGLSVGFCAVFFMLLYVKFELSYDRYHEKADNIYRVVTDIHSSTGVDYQSTSAPLAKAAAESFPEVKEAVRYFLDYFIVQREMNSSDFAEEKIAYAEASLFSVFSFPLIGGNTETALEAPFQVVLSESAAHKYFGSNDPIGKTLYLDGKLPATVTGVMKDIPANSHFHVDMLLSMSTLLTAFNPGMGSKWERFGMSTYLLVQDHADINRLNTELTTIMNNGAQNKNVQYELMLEPLKDVYLKGKARGSRTGSITIGNAQNLYIFSLVAVLVLFIAGFNFVNLSTAVSFQRNKEVGVRKVIGATKGNLFGQFLLDAILICVLAFFLALFLAALLLPVFNQLSGKVIAGNIFSEWQTILLFLPITLVFGILSGIYPATLLIGFRPVLSLKGIQARTSGRIVLRKSLVIAQFAVSVILIVATLVAYNQLHFMQSRPTGFKKDLQLAIDYHFALPHTMLRQELLTIPGVKSVSVSSAIPGKPNRKMPISIENKDGNLIESSVDMYFVDADFIPQYELPVVAGRAFSSEMATDSSTTLIVNEAMVKSLGYHHVDDIIGKRFEQGWANGGRGAVIGVLKNFHIRSLREEIEPLAMRIHPGAYTFLTVNLDESNWQTTFEKMTAKWKSFAPDLPLIHFFVDDALQQQYITDQQTSRLILCFSILAVFISCLGLYALSWLSIMQRMKEVSVRKVMGAGITQIVTLLTKDFLQLVLISVLIGIPLGWWLTNQWLQSFAYRIDIGIWVFLVAGSVALLIAIFVVGVQTIKAAIANPVKALRSE